MMDRMLLYGCLPEYKTADDFLVASTRPAAISRLLALADRYCLSGNLWHSFIAWLLINDENAFSLACELRSAEQGGLRTAAALDFKQLFYLFFSDISRIEKEYSFIFKDFSYSKPANSSACARIGERANELGRQLAAAINAEDFMRTTTNFYEQYGVGLFGLNRAFHLSGDVNTQPEFTPINSFEEVKLSNLWGYERQKNMLCENTTAFLEGKVANNVLLYGDSGTGKSTCVKAILNEYYPRGLRMIEVYKHRFNQLPQIIEQLRCRNYKFIIFMDDLSFEDFEVEYKFLKAVIEGGIEKKPDNVLIYATSNRRHLIRESFKERSSDDDVHNNDTVQEKLSLSERFGLMINFTRPLEREYFEIVKYLAALNNIDMDEQQLIALARQWGLRHSGVSGRVAQQFISSLLGR